MRSILSLVVILALIFVVWWFWGREPHIKMGNPSDPVLIYVEPVWNGWKSRGFKWIDGVPEIIKKDHPEAKGWWHVVKQTVPTNQLPQIDPSHLNSSMKWEQYFVWVPLYYEHLDLTKR